jgi:hypothetical protein
MMKHSTLVAFDVLLFAVLAACAGSAQGHSDSARAVRLGDTITRVDTAPTPVTHDTAHVTQAASPPPKRLPPLSADAQRIAEGLVFAPRSQTWYLVAVRARRLLVDLGRVDVSIGKDTAMRLAFAEAAKRYSPIPVGGTLRLHGPWGVEDATLAEFDTWNGRIVARVHTSPRLDTLVRRRDVLLGAGMYVDSVTLAREDSVRKAETADSIARVAVLDSTVKAAGKDSAKVRAALTMQVAKKDSAKRDTAAPHDSIAVVETCTRDSVPPSLAARVLAVRDSIERWLDDSAKAPYPRLEKNAKVQSWAVPGCYGIGRVLILAGRRNPTMEFSAERAFMVRDTGAVLRLRLSDLRFHFHEPLAVFDADGDGIDDLATRALGDRSGGLSVMRLDTATKRLQRLASGFAWETL